MCLGIAAKELGDQRDITELAEKWYKRAGVNDIETIRTAAEGEIESVSLKQSVPRVGDRYLRDQVIDVAVYKWDGSTLRRVKLVENVPISSDGKIRIKD